MASNDPPYLPVGTDVSAKYRGAFCEAKVKRLEKSVKCKIFVKETQSSMVVKDDQINGPLKLNVVVEVKLPDAGKTVEAVINKMTDCSMYTVVFDDADERTLRRTQLCLKGQKHFIESETLDNLPLSHPEHFGTPVMHGKKSKRGRPDMSGSEDSAESDSDESIPKRASYKGRSQDLVGKVMCVETGDKRKTLQVPVLVVLPDANPSIELKMKDHLIIRSFKDGKYYSFAKKDVKEFSREMGLKNEDKSLKNAMEKALLYLENKELPPAWDRDTLLGPPEESDSGDEESSDDEPSEEKDHFVAHLYKFMDDRATPINKGPTIGSKDLNLYKLFKTVQNFGGYNKVTNQMRWRLVYSKMSLPPCSNASTQIKNAYKKYLHAFEDFYRKLGSTMGTISRPGRSRHNSGRGILSFRGKDKDHTPTKEKGDGKASDMEKENLKDVGVRTPVSDFESKSEIGSDIDAEVVTPKPERRTPKREKVTRSKDDSKDDSKESTINVKEEKEKEKKETKKEETSKRVTRKEIEERKEEKKEKEKEAEIKKEVEVKRGAKRVKEESVSPVKDVKKEMEEEKQQQKKPGRRRSMRKEDSKKETEEEEEKEKEVKEKEVKEKEKEVKEKEKEVKEKEKEVKEKEKDVKVKEKEKEVKEKGKEEKEKAREKEVKEKEKEVKVKEKEVKVKEKEVKEKEKEVKEKETKKEPLKKEKDEKPPKKEKEEKKETKKDEKKDKKPVKKGKEATVTKKPEVEEEAGSDKEEEESESEDDSDYSPGTKLRVRYGRGRNQKVYEAKVVESSNDGFVQFLVHYAGWNNRYDEWIRPERIVQVCEKPETMKRKTKSPKIMKGPLKKKPGKPGSPAIQSRSSPTPESNSSSKAKSPVNSSSSSTTSLTQSFSKARPTRSNSVEFHVLDGLLPKKRKRKMSGTLDSSTQGSDSEDNAESDEQENEGEPSTEETTSKEKGKKTEIEEGVEVLEKEDTSMEINKTMDGEDLDDDLDKSPPLLSKITDLDKALDEERKEDDPDRKEESFDLEPDKLEMNVLMPVVERQEVFVALEKNNKVVCSDKTEKAVKTDTSEKIENKEMGVVEENTPKSKKADIKEKEKEPVKEKKKEPEKKAKKEFKWEVEEGLSFLRKGETAEKVSKLPEERVSPVKSYEGESPYDFKDEPDFESDYNKIRERRVKPIIMLEEIHKETVKDCSKQENLLDPSSTAPMMERRKSFEEKLVSEGEKILPLETVDGKEKREKAKSDTETEKKEKTPKGRKREAKDMKKTKAEKKSFQDVPEIVRLEHSIMQKEDTGPVVKKFKEAPVLQSVCEVIEIEDGNSQNEKETVVKVNSENEKKKVKKKTKKKLNLETTTCEENKEKSVVKKETKISKAKGEKGVITKPKESARKSKGKEAKETVELPDFNLICDEKVTESADIDLRCEEKIRSRSVSPETVSEKKPDFPESRGFETDLSLASNVEKELKDTSEVPNSNVPKEVSKSEISSRTLFVNTPPTSPEQEDTSVKDNSISSNKLTFNEQIKDNSSSSLKEEEGDSKTDNSQITGGESPTGNASPSSNRSSGSSGIVAGSEGSIDVPVSLNKRRRESDELTPSKRRKRSSRGKSLQEKTRKSQESDSEEASSLPGKFSPQYSANHDSNNSKGSAVSSSSGNTARNRSPRPSKYNFNLEEGKYLEGEMRISFLVDKIQEMRKIYMNLKSEVATIDRRRKRLRRKEKEKDSASSSGNNEVEAS